MINYVVVLNAEEQYSVWPSDRDIPDGWHSEGFSGDKESCLLHIGEVWADITPLSVRTSRQRGAN